MANRDYIAAFAEIYEKCRPFTMTSRNRMHAIFTSIQKIVTESVPGDIVECGVWKGGSMMMAAMSLKYFGDTSRALYLYDTFEGMPEPGAVDYDLYERPASKQWKKKWCYSPLQEVINNMITTCYPSDKIIYVTGLVEETIPGKIPDKISLLRLDTDWYGSTKHELEHLYQLVSKGGILIVDDYGHWMGAKQAVDEYFGGIELQEIDYTGRMLVK